MEKFYKIEDNNLFKIDLNGESIPLEFSGEIEEAIEHFKLTFEKLSITCEEVFSKIDQADNKASFIAKLELLLSQLDEHQGIGDYVSLKEKISSYLEELKNKVAANRLNNTEQKAELLANLKVIVEENNWKAITEVKEIQQRWIKIGRPSVEVEEQLTTDFKTSLDEFFSNRQEYSNSQKELVEVRVQSYRELIIRIEDINETGSSAKRLNEINEIREQWKNTGSVSKVVYQTLFEQYKKGLDTYFEKLKQNRKNNKTQSKEKNLAVLEEKKALLEKLKELKNNKEDFSLKEVITLQKEWKKVGRIPSKMINSIADEFYQGCDYIFEYVHMQNGLKKRKISLTKENQLKAIKRIIRENESEIETFQMNRERMMSFASASDVNGMVEQRLKELERKLKAKKEILAELSV